jgi:hypothetical protein
MLRSRELVLIRDCRASSGIIGDGDWLLDGRSSCRGLLRDVRLRGGVGRVMPYPRFSD